MRIEPHENLTVLSIRHDWFGPGRFHPAIPRSHPSTHSARHLHDVHLHHARLGFSLRPVIEQRAIEHVSGPQPADCRPCHSGEPARPSMNPVLLLYAPTIAVAWPFNAIHADPAALLPPIAVQRFAHGQPIPATGGLLDVLA